MNGPRNIAINYIIVSVILTLFYFIGTIIIHYSFFLGQKNLA